MAEEAPRSRTARRAAEAALVSVVHHYGTRPEFVLLGGLVPELLCSRSRFLHAGTTDVDVQLDLEIAYGATHAVRLEKALLAASFTADTENVWRWSTGLGPGQTVIKFEMLADRDDQPSNSTIVFKECNRLGAANLRGTGFASKDFSVRRFGALVEGAPVEVEINVAGLGGFLCAKTAAAHARSKAKDWYDVAFVLLHNDAGGPVSACQAAARLLESGGASLRFQLSELRANFSARNSQGTQAYVEQMLVDHPDLVSAELATDAMVAVQAFHDGLLGSPKPMKGLAMNHEERVAAKATTVATSNVGEQDEMAASIREGLARVKGKPTLLCIPMWGHEGDGKTTALLTAMHYADSAHDGMGLRYVSDPDLLTDLDAQENYQALNLRARAASTRKDLGELEEQFFETCKWPRGTDRGYYHFLELDNTVGAVTFCLFPDMPGGNYEEKDDESRIALARSHAWGVLVDGARYVGSGIKAKNYRDDVRGLVQKAVRLDIPFCVMITKADRYEGPSSPVDAAHVEITSFVGQLNASVPYTILRTSVTGVHVKAGDDPPPASQRRPRDVVKAYAWLVDQALRRPEKLSSVVPVTSRTPAPLAVAAPVFTPELRRVTEQSGARGRPICDCSDDAQKRVVAFVLDDGTVTEVTVPMRTGAEPTERAIGVVPTLDVPTSLLQGEYVGGELLLGARRQPKCLWVGKKGDLRKTSFGLDVYGWSPINAKRIVGIDNAGRLHFLKLIGDRWQAMDTVDDLAPAGTTGGACQVVNGRSVWVGVGDTVVSLALEPEDRIGARTPPVPFPGAGSFVGNRRGLLGSIVERDKAHFAGVFDGTAYHELGPAASATIAVAQDGHLAAWLGPDGKLTAASVAGAERTVLTELAASHPDGIQALCWTGGGEALVALIDEKTWAVFVPKGIGR